jgi:hypothetical protein
VPQEPKVSRKDKVGLALQAQRAVPMVAAATPPLRWAVRPGRATARKVLPGRLEQLALTVALPDPRATTEQTLRTVAVRPNPLAAAMATAQPPMEATVSKAPAQTAQPAEIKVMVNPATKVPQ